MDNLANMSSYNRELVFLILQFLDEEKLEESARKLEQESGFFFNVKYLEDKAHAGEWDELERYLSGFTKLDDNRHSLKIFFEIRKQKYLEALDRQDRAKAVEILVKDLKVFSTFDEELFKETTQLLTVDNLRENEKLSKYGGTMFARSKMLVELKKLIETNPSLRDKLIFPNLKSSRLQTLINQSFNWQHQLCKNPRPNPDIKTLFTDHACGTPNGPCILTASLGGGLPKTGFPQIRPHVPFLPTASSASCLANWMSNPDSITSDQAHVAIGPVPVPPNQATRTKHPRSPLGSAAAVDYQTADSEKLNKRTRPVEEAGMEPVQISQKPRVSDDMPEKTKRWKLTVITDPSQCQCLTLPKAASEPVTKVARLLYMNNGVGVLALGSNAVHKLWKWTPNEQNPSGKATASALPHSSQPSSGNVMINDTIDTNPEEAVPCMALSKTDSYLVSASGGKVSLFNMITFKVMTTFMPPPPATTFLAFHPQDNNIIAIGMEDSSIHIYNIRVDEVSTKLQGHQKRITGLAFSNSQNVLVSSGGDARLCVWSTDTWEKLSSKKMSGPTSGDTRIQFHTDQIHILVVHEAQLAIYNTPKLDQQQKRTLLTARISDGTYSCNSQLIYMLLCDDYIVILDAQTLGIRCRIDPSGYLSPGVSSSSVFPLVVAACPGEPNQFAIGLSDGSVKVLEPSESAGQWGFPPPGLVKH